MKYAKFREVTPAGDDVWFNDSAGSKPFALFELPARAFEKKMSISDILNESEKYVNRVLDQARGRVGV